MPDQPTLANPNLVPITLPAVAEPAAATAPRALLGITLEALRAWLVEAGHERFRAEQIMDWIYGKGATAFEEFSNLSKALRAWLQSSAALYSSTITTRQVSTDGTQKLLLTWPDGRAVETVLIPDGDRATACVSSQVGCPVGCKFCASGLRGVERNLTAAEIVEQALRISQLVRAQAPAQPAKNIGGFGGPRAPRLSNIVFMGMGEPLANFDALLSAIRILNAPWGPNIGARKITVSTVGLPKQIRRLAEEELQLNLALSLHAPDEELRRELIPWGKVPLEELLDACRYYFEKTGREITLEYILLEGVNNQPHHAARLAALCRRLRCNVNLLRYNPVAGVPYERPSAESAFDFQSRLRSHGVNAHVRTSRGKDIDAACGQLRRKVEAGAAEPAANREA